MGSELFTSGNHEEPISAEQAAALIFRTTRPNVTQVGGVRDLMRRGELRQSARRHFTTTRQAVAEYLTSRELRKTERSRGAPQAADPEEPAAVTTAVPAKAAPPRPSRNRGDVYLRDIYREYLNDYFLSLIVYGRSKDRSEQFQRRVFHGRCALLLMLLALLWWSFQSMLVQPVTAEPWAEAGASRVQRDQSAEKKVVQEFLRKYRQQAVMMDILPGAPRPGGKTVRVRYSHQLTDKRTNEVRTVIEDTVFVIAGNEILRDEQPGSADLALEAKLFPGSAAKGPSTRPSVNGLLPPPPPQRPISLPPDLR